MKTDSQLKADVVTELNWDPSINAAHVGVTAEDGVVTLSGHLATFQEKHAIERAVQRVAGVKAVAVELDVRLSPGHRRSDTEIAKAAEAALSWHTMIASERIGVKVDQGWITLSGEVDWDYQRSGAENVVRPMIGVVGVRNVMTLKASLTPSNVSSRIQEALKRQAETDSSKIEVKVNGSTLTLCGRVESWVDRAVAERAAWSAPGIGQVVNDLSVGPPP